MQRKSKENLEMRRLDLLPVEILCEICGHLDVHSKIILRRVCRRLSNVTYLRESWRNVQRLHINHTIGYFLVRVCRGD